MKSKNSKYFSIKTKWFVSLTIAILCGSIIFSSIKTYACESCLTGVTITEDIEWQDGNSSPNPAVDGRSYPVGTTPFLQRFVDDEFAAHKKKFVEEFWQDNILPALKASASQAISVREKQTQMLGNFMNANINLDKKRELKQVEAQARKDYQPSTGMCEFGSNIKSLAATEFKMNATAVIFSQRSINRQLGNAFTAGSNGQASDQESRIKQFSTTYCDVADNNNGLTEICSRTASAARVNKDIDYTRTVGSRWTTNVDVVNGGAKASADEEDVFALGNNLFAHYILTRTPFEKFGPSSGLEMTALQENYLDARALIAKRSVAENSYHMISAMVSAGTGGSQKFMAGIMKQLGIQDASAIGKMIGEKPSYYAQMEVLTKKIYQNPDFYTSLYDTPANVQRKSVALQAIGLMQKFDAFKSHLRAEASLSVLLELAVMDLQDQAEEDVGANSVSDVK